MSKHLKTFLIATVLIFSFCFIGNVSALTLSGVNLNDDFFNNGWQILEGTHYQNNGNLYHQVDFPYVYCQNYNTAIDCYFLTDYSYKSQNSSFIELSSTTPNKYSMAPGFRYNISKRTYTAKYANGFYVYKDSSYASFDIYNGNTLVRSKSFDYNVSSSYTVNFHLNGGTVSDYTDIALPIYYENDYQKEFESDELLDYIENIHSYTYKTNNTFLGWFYDSSFTQPYDSSNSLSSDIDLYAKWGYNPNITFHLNGGFIRQYNIENIQNNIKNRMCELANCHQYDSWATNPYEIMMDNITERKIDTFLFEHDTSDNQEFKRLGIKLVNDDYSEDIYGTGSSGGGHGGSGRDDNQYITQDFTERVNYDEVNNYIANLDIGKSEMIFLGWYYDNNSENPFSLQDNIENDVDLYAKWRYKNVDDFLANTNFIEYTFDSDYDYAIINRGNNNGDIYIKLPFNNYELEIYEYNENTNTYKDGASVCLVPIYNKDGWYIYDINTLFTSNQEVLILPKYLLEQAEYENNEDMYKFYMTDNAYISYTNDLKHTIITDSNGDQIDTNLQNSYELSEQYKQLYKDEKNIYSQIKIFLKQIKNYISVIKEMFQYLFDSLNTTIRSFIIFIIVLVIISAILRIIRRG